MNVIYNNTNIYHVQLYVYLSIVSNETNVYEMFISNK